MVTGLQCCKTVFDFYNYIENENPKICFLHYKNTSIPQKNVIDYELE